MNLTIQIFAFSWNTLSIVQQVLSSHLLKYSIFYIDKPIDGYHPNDYPIITFQDQILMHPTKDQLIAFLSLNPMQINYFDTLIIGSDMHAFFALDYFAKKNVSVKCIGSDLEMTLSNLNRYMTGIHFETNNILPDMLIEERVQSIQKLNGQIYFCIRTQDNCYYTKSLFITLLEEKLPLPLLFDTSDVKNFVFDTKESFLHGLKNRRFRNMKKRQFIIYSESNEFLFQIEDVFNRICASYQSFDFSLHCIFTKKFDPLERAYKSILETNKNIRVFEHMKIKRIEYKLKECFIETELRKSQIDALLFIQSLRPCNYFLKDFIKCDKDGFIKKDQEYGTQYLNLFTMRERKIAGSEKLQLQDTFDPYLTTALVCQKILQFVATH